MALEIIPKITDPRGEGWPQPARKEIKIIGGMAFMSPTTMLKLTEYSHCSPTGTYEGKMWCGVVRGNRFLYWFDVSPEYKNQCRIYYRRIIKGNRKWIISKD